MFNKLKATNRRLSKSRKVIILISTALVVVGILVTGWFFWLQPYLNKVNTPPLTFDENYANLVEETNKKINNNDYAGALSAIDISIANTSDNIQKAKLYILKSVRAFSIGKFSDAYEFASKAEELDPNTTSAELMGDALFAMGYKERSTSYYAKAISRVDKSNEVGQAEINHLNTKIETPVGNNE